MPYTIQGTTVKQRTGAFIVEMAINLPSPSTGAEEEFVQLRVMVSAFQIHARAFQNCRKSPFSVCERN